jgi:hypothetical protein
MSLKWFATKPIEVVMAVNLITFVQMCGSSAATRSPDASSGPASEEPSASSSASGGRSPRSPSGADPPPRRDELSHRGSPHTEALTTGAGQVPPCARAHRRRGGDSGTGRKRWCRTRKLLRCKGLSRAKPRLPRARACRSPDGRAARGAQQRSHWRKPVSTSVRGRHGHV